MVGVFPPSLRFPEPISYTARQHDIGSHIGEQLQKSVMCRIWLFLTHVGVGRWLDHLSDVEFRVLQDRRRDPPSEYETCSSQPDIISDHVPEMAEMASLHKRRDDDKYQDPISVDSI